MFSSDLMKKRPFASLSTQEALHIAIGVEARNAKIYQQLAELFGSFSDRDSSEIAAVFLEMAAEEHTHGSELQERYNARFGTSSCSLTEDDIDPLIEAPHVPNGNIFAIARAGAAMAPAVQALEIALAAEEGALRFYGYLSEITDDPELRAFYHELAHFEAEHAAELRRKIELAQSSTAWAGA
jgi:rubrerythrin